MALTIDHAVFAGSDQGTVAACEAVGLDPAYGGEHDGVATQMSLVGFPDGSYLELMTPIDPGTEPSGWAGIVDHWAGPEHWCIEADVRELLRRTITAGAPVAGPHDGSRRRPDGTQVEWTTGRYGPERLRGVLPFAIRDRTPHHYRVPADAVAEGPLTGVAEVVLGLEAVDPAMEWFRRLHAFPSPVEIGTPLEASVSTIPGQPASLALPEPGSRLATRLEATAQGPVAFLLGTDDFDAAGDRYALTAPEPWGAGRVAWFDHDELRLSLGVIEHH